MRKFLLSLALVSFSFGAGEMEGFLNQITSNLSYKSPYSIDAQQRGYYFGGGVVYRAPSAVLQPFHVVPPSLRAGCGAIDLTFGAFSYLNPEYFVEFAKKVISQSPAFAFDFALEAMCSQCSEIMKTLTHLANQINALSLDSCQFFAFLREVLSQTIGGKIERSESNGWLSAINKTLESWANALEEFNKHLTHLGCNTPKCYLFSGYVSVAHRFTKEVSSAFPYWNTTDMVYLITALFGDVGIVNNTPQCLLPISGTEYRIIKLAESYEDLTLPGITAIDPITKDLEIRDLRLRSIRAMVKQRLDSIISKMENKQPLSSDDLRFLAQYDFPAFAILRILSPSPVALRSVQPILEEYLAYELLYQFVGTLYMEYSKVLSKASAMMKDHPAEKVPGEIKECLTKINPEMARKTVENLRDEIVKAKTNLISQLRLALDLYELERKVYSRFANHPLMSSYLFANTLR